MCENRNVGAASSTIADNCSNDSALRLPKILIFDEAVSNLDQPTAEQFAQTVNRLKGKVTMLFITHHVPKGLRVDQTFTLKGVSER